MWSVLCSKPALAPTYGSVSAASMAALVLHHTELINVITFTIIRRFTSTTLSPFLISLSPSQDTNYLILLIHTTNPLIPTDTWATPHPTLCIVRTPPLSLSFSVSTPSVLEMRLSTAGHLHCFPFHLFYGVYCHSSKTG